MSGPEKTAESFGGKVAAALIVLLPLACLLPALGGGFLIWDDNVNLLDNPWLWQPAGAALRWMFTNIEDVQRYKPINWLAWRGLGAVFGLDPVPFHALNLVLHVANSLLFFRVCHAFLQTRNRLGAARRGPMLLAAFAAALWWAIHPLRVEPVAWISGAGYPLSTFFALLCVGAFQRHLRDGHKAARWGAVGWFGLSLLSYPAAASLPALLLALVVLTPGSGGAATPLDLRRLARLLAPYAVMAFVLLSATLLTRMETTSEVWHHPVSLSVVGLGSRVMQAFAVWVWYLGKTLLPLHLSPLYPDFSMFSPLGLRAVSSGLVFALISVAAWRMRRRFPEAPVFWCAYVLLTVPVLGVTDPPFSPADRYTYVPSLSLALLLASLMLRGLGHASRWWRGTTLGLGAAVLLGCLVATVAQLQFWRTPVSFFTHAIACVEPHPAAADLHWRLGLHYLTMDDTARAEHEFGETLRLDPNQDDAARYLRVLRKRDRRATKQPPPVTRPETP